MRTLAAGSKFGQGRFTLKKILGQGGMGMVWLAQDERLDELVALKFLPPQIRFDAVGLAGLRRETQRSRKLTHPQIIRIHDLHETEGEDAAIAMEYVDGMTLSALRLRQRNEIFTWPALAPLVKQLCEALDYAHGEKVIHRDLKPANLMMDSHGRLKLADFGIASVISDSVSRMSNQPTSGTLAYMSPQQINGERPQATDDIYSLGVTLYELLTGTPPFHSGPILHQVLNNEPPPPQARLAELGLENEIPPDVEAMIMACLAKDPSRRPQSARAVADWIGLQPVPHPQSLAATIVQTEESPSGEKHSLRGKMIWAAIVILLLGAGGWLWATKKIPEQIQTASAKQGPTGEAVEPAVSAQSVTTAGRTMFADDFENPAVTEKSAFWDWTNPAGKSVVMESGNHFLRLESANIGNSCKLSATLPLPQAWENIFFSIRIRAGELKIDSAHLRSGAKLSVELLDETKTVVYSSPTSQVTNESDWVVLTKLVSREDAPASVRYVRFSPILNAAAGIADFDDIKVTAPAYNTNGGRIVLTENFETLDGYGKPKGEGQWRATVIGEKRIIRTENGNNFLEYQARATTNFMNPVGMHLNLKPEWKTLRISVRVRTQNLDSPAAWCGATLSAVFYDELTDAAKSWKMSNEYKTSYVKTNSDWRLLEKTLPVPPGAKHLGLSPALSYASGVADFDDIIVTVVEENKASR